MRLQLLSGGLLTTLGGDNIKLVSIFNIPPVYHPVRMVLPVENDPAHVMVASSQVNNPVRMTKPVATDPVKINVASSNQ